MDPKKTKTLFITQIFLSPVHKMMVKGITRVRFHPLVTLNACTEWIQSLVVEMFWSRSTWWTQTRCSWSHDGIHPSLNYTAVSFGGSQDVRAETMWDRLPVNHRSDTWRQRLCTHLHLRVIQSGLVTWTARLWDVGWNWSASRRSCRKNKVGGFEPRTSHSEVPPPPRC